MSDMSTNPQKPDYIFESSWEVCNRVGGIYTVLSTRAKTLKASLGDRLIFIGPDFGTDNPLFTEMDGYCEAWKHHAALHDGISVRIGRWNIEGSPLAFLVDFKPLFSDKDAIYGRMWSDFGVDSLHAYGDYDESCMFAVAVGKVVESYYRFCLTPADHVIFHANEWMLGMSVLYLQKHVPEVATVFTTHATSIGRSIAGNGKPLYSCLSGYDGDQMAAELNMQSKHSIEKQTALHVDCFTTVSRITDDECRQLLTKPADVVLPNGFEPDIVPKGAAYTAARRGARRLMLRVASCLMGEAFADDTLVLATTGRYEFRNKGIDVFIEALSRLQHDSRLHRKVLALITVPAWLDTFRSDLRQRLDSGLSFSVPLSDPYITHSIHNAGSDRIIGMLRYHGLLNASAGNVRVMFVPCYLDGRDGIYNKEYYDLVPGFDLTAYPSYYEPWGYTPLESMAFHVPTVTTDLAGFGRWVLDTQGDRPIGSGVRVLHRTDDNYFPLTDSLVDTILEYAGMDGADVRSARLKAAALASKASWSHFIGYYCRAYDVAFRNAMKRCCREAAGSAVRE